MRILSHYAAAVLFHILGFESIAGFVRRYYSYMTYYIPICSLWQYGICHNVIKGGINIKTNLRKLRREKDFTQVFVQMKTGIDQSMLSKYETGERLPPIDVLLLLADFYGVSLDYILCRTEKREVNR